MKIQQISFKNNNFQTEQKTSSAKSSAVTPSSDTFELSNKKNNTKKYIFAGIGIASIIIAIAKHKQIGKFIDNIFNKTRNVQQAPLENNVINNINNQINTLLGNGETVPKYLYHMTSKENYASMLQDGVIKKSLIENGVFLTDFKSFALKYPIDDLKGMVKWYGGLYPGAAQFGSASNTVVVLKIPTESLQKDLTMVRKIRLQSNGAMNNSISLEWAKAHDINVDDYKILEKYPLEFLYNSEIPVSNIQIVNEVQLNNLNEGNFAEQFLISMFKNKEEEQVLGIRFNDANPTYAPLSL